METGKLYMQYSENGMPEVVFEPVNGTVWLTANQTAQFLGCFPAKGKQIFILPCFPYIR